MMGWLRCLLLTLPQQCLRRRSTIVWNVEPVAAAFPYLPLSMMWYLSRRSKRKGFELRTFLGLIESLIGCTLCRFWTPARFLKRTNSVVYTKHDLRFAANSSPAANNASRRVIDWGLGKNWSCYGSCKLEVCAIIQIMRVPLEE